MPTQGAGPILAPDVAHRTSLGLCRKDSPRVGDPGISHVSLPKVLIIVETLLGCRCTLGLLSGQSTLELHYRGALLELIKVDMGAPDRPDTFCMFLLIAGSLDQDRSISALETLVFLAMARLSVNCIRRLPLLEVGLTVRQSEVETIIRIEIGLLYVMRRITFPCVRACVYATGYPTSWLATGLSSGFMIKVWMHEVHSPRAQRAPPQYLAHSPKTSYAW